MSEPRDLSQDAMRATIDIQWITGVLFVFIMVAQTVNFLQAQSNHKELLDAIKNNKEVLKEMKNEKP